MRSRFFATEKERNRFIPEFQKEVGQHGDEVLKFDKERMRRWQAAEWPGQPALEWQGQLGPGLRKKRGDRPLPVHHRLVKGSASLFFPAPIRCRRV